MNRPLVRAIVIELLNELLTDAVDDDAGEQWKGDTFDWSLFADRVRNEWERISNEFKKAPIQMVRTMEADDVRGVMENLPQLNTKWPDTRLNVESYTISEVERGLFAKLFKRPRFWSIVVTLRFDP